MGSCSLTFSWVYLLFCYSSCMQGQAVFQHAFGSRKALLREQQKLLPLFYETGQQSDASGRPTFPEPWGELRRAASPWELCFEPGKVVTNGFSVLSAGAWFNKMWSKQSSRWLREVKVGTLVMAGKMFAVPVLYVSVTSPISLQEGCYFSLSFL